MATPIKDKDTTSKPKRPSAPRAAAAKSVAPKAPAAKAPAPSKPAAHKPAAAKPAKAPASAPEKSAVEGTVKPAAAAHAPKKAAPSGRYVFATGRRKTAVANVRVFTGSGENVVNKKKFDIYFFHSTLREQAMKPFQLTGMEGSYFFTASIQGGGMQAQAYALGHGLSRALSEINPDIRTVLKTNGLLTRDDRKKERKKPGLKRARRAGQWAKR
jgi:small subunit ribosomal protein S9